MDVAAGRSTKKKYECPAWESNPGLHGHNVLSLPLDELDQQSMFFVVYKGIINKVKTGLVGKKLPGRGSLPNFRGIPMTLSLLIRANYILQ